MMPSVVPAALVEFLRQHEQEYEYRAVEINNLKSNDSVQITVAHFWVVKVFSSNQ